MTTPVPAGRNGVVPRPPAAGAARPMRPVPGHHPGGQEGAGSPDPGLLSRRQALIGLGLLGVSAVGADALLAGCSTGSAKAPTSERSAAGSTPNVLLIMADDMRYDHLPYLPDVRRLIAAEGRTFSQARCNVPLCQPSRVGLVTGQMSKHNGDLGIGFGGTHLKDHDNTIGKWMADAGYRCGLFGKYVNATDGRGGIDAPAGFETWREFLPDEYPDGHFKVHYNSGTRTIRGRYDTDYLAAEALDFMRGDAPFLCIVTPTEPHAPFHPRADLARRWSDVRWPIVDEVDVSDKPPWIQALAPLTAQDLETIRTDVIGALRELSAVDDMVRKIITGLDRTVLDDTVVIFTSDNGVHHGEHRRRGPATKAGPYEVGLRVPLLVRGPGFAPGPVVDVPSMVMQDITATILDVGAATAGLPDQAGLSLAGLAANPSAQAQRVLLHEIGDGFERQTGDGITTGPANGRGFRKLYRYPSVRSGRPGPYTYEAYDLDTDPDELSNWADAPGRRPERDALEATLDQLVR